MQLHQCTTPGSAPVAPNYFHLLFSFYYKKAKTPWILWCHPSNETWGCLKKKFNSLGNIFCESTICSSSIWECLILLGWENKIFYHLEGIDTNCWTLCIDHQCFFSVRLRIWKFNCRFPLLRVNSKWMQDVNNFFSWWNINEKINM